MTCEACEEKQNIAFNKNIDDSTSIAYLRVGTGNIAIIACDKHLREFFAAQKKQPIRCFNCNGEPSLWSFFPDKKSGVPKSEPCCKKCFEKLSRKVKK